MPKGRVIVCVCVCVCVCVLQVWEIRGAELTSSPVHMAAYGSGGIGGRGLALRFPRFLRIREDKTVDSATSPTDLLDLFHKQVFALREQERESERASEREREREN